MAETGNYQLNQWEKTDRIQMEDFNADNAKTDQALAALQTEKANQADLPWVKIGEATLTESAQQVSVNVPDVEQYISLFLVFDAVGSTSMGLLWSGMSGYTTFVNNGQSQTTRCCGFILAVPMPKGGALAQCSHGSVTSDGTIPTHNTILLTSATTSGSVTVSITGSYGANIVTQLLAAGSYLAIYGLKK